MSENFPTELQLVINKAKTISWRMGVAWALVSIKEEVLVCNGRIFNQHTHQLIQDLHLNSDARKLYISYCPLVNDLHSRALLEALRLSKLAEVHVHAEASDGDALSALSKEICISVYPWTNSDNYSTQNIGIPWVRLKSRPWVHIVCSSSLGGGEFPFSRLSKQLGVLPYVTLKGMGSSILYVKSENDNNFIKKMEIAKPRLVKHKKTLVRNLQTLTSSTASLVTVVCDPGWLALLLQLNLANEVSYFFSLSSIAGSTTAPSSIIDFPNHENWIVSSSETLGNFMRIVLKRKYNMSPWISSGHSASDAD